MMVDIGWLMHTKKNTVEILMFLFGINQKLNQMLDQLS